MDEDTDENSFVPGGALSASSIKKSSPLSSDFATRAKQLSPRRSDILMKRDALMGAYKKLIEAQKSRSLNIKDPGGMAAGAAGLLQSMDPNMKAFGASQAARLAAMQQQADKLYEDNVQANLTGIKLAGDDLGFLQSDQDKSTELLKEAENKRYKDMMINLQMAKLLKSRQPSINAPSTFYSDLGAPQYEGPNPYEGLDNVGQRQLRMAYEKDLDKMRDQSNEYITAINTMKRFDQLNEKVKNNLIGTGPIAAYLPNVTADLKEMESKAAEITPQMRVPGSGSSSDFDAKMFQKATVGTDKEYETNKNIARAYIENRQDNINKSDFFEAYLAANGHLRGAETKWKKYLDDNPIFKDEDFKLNEKRSDWKTYFSSGNKAKEEGKVSEPVELKGATDETPPPPSGYDPEKWKLVYSKMPPEKQKLFKKP